MNPNFGWFEAIFNNERMPKNKDQYMQKLYQFYIYGRINAEKEIKRKFNDLLFKE